MIKEQLYRVRPRMGRRKGRDCRGRCQKDSQLHRWHKVRFYQQLPYSPCADPNCPSFRPQCPTRTALCFDLNVRPKPPLRKKIPGYLYKEGEGSLSLLPTRSSDDCVMAGAVVRRPKSSIPTTGPGSGGDPRGRGEAPLRHLECHSLNPGSLPFSLLGPLGNDPAARPPNRPFSRGRSQERCNDGCARRACIPWGSPSRAGRTSESWRLRFRVVSRAVSPLRILLPPHLLTYSLTHYLSTSSVWILGTVLCSRTPSLWSKKGAD